MQRHDVYIAADRIFLSRVPGEAFDANLGMENSGRVARRAKDLVMARPAESDVADHFARNRQIGKHFGLGAKNRDSPFAALGTVEIGDPEIAGRIEYTAIPAGTLQIVENFRLPRADSLSAGIA